MTDPMSPKIPRKGKIINLRVQFLDDQWHAFQIPVKALGLALWDAVCRHIQLLESDYFDLQFCDEDRLQCWLDREKQVIKQLPTLDTPLVFSVKFYTPDPALLEDEFTRYLFALQVKRDLMTGMLPCSDNTQALLASYIVQAEIGDFLIDEYIDYTYLSLMKLVQRQTVEMEKKIMEYHKTHIGESPEEADLNLLDTARKVELYGTQMHPARADLVNLLGKGLTDSKNQSHKSQELQDHESVNLCLAVSSHGILVFQNFTKINTFSWAKIRKLSFKRKKFLIKLHPENYGYYKDTVEFFFESRNECKGFWKKCIEHHAFFRCHSIKKGPRNKSRIVSRGSSFRYSGRTQKQLVEFVKEHYVKRPPFERSVSGRISTRSTSVTPRISAKTSAHNSMDLHNSTASSGSHTLDVSQDNQSTRVETAEVHSESSLSGSRSLGSPKVDHSSHRNGSSQQNHREREESGDEVEAPVDKVPTPPPSLLNTPPPAYSEVSKKPAFDRKYSAPVLNSRDLNQIVEERHLTRSPEVENIPEEVVHVEEQRNSFLRNLNLSDAPSCDESYRDNESPPPPPPPPLTEDEYRLSPPRLRSTSSLPGDNSNVCSDSNTELNINLGLLSSLPSIDQAEETTPVKKKSRKYPTDRAYFIIKELLMTERTYKKDLEVVVKWFRNAVTCDEHILTQISKILFLHLEPIYQFHCSFVKDVEHKIGAWESKTNSVDRHSIGDLLNRSLSKVLEVYKTYIEMLDDILQELESFLKKNKFFFQIYRDFESQKVCYLPLNTFLVKPGHRLLHYKLLLERLILHYTEDHMDLEDCKAALAKAVEVTNELSDKLRVVENVQKLIELQRDLVGIDSLVHVDRFFIREGCLQKFSRKGYQQRMFFLFSDMLVYTSRSATSLLQFKVHGQLPLKGMMVENSDHSKMAVPNSFAIYGGNKCILVAASSQEEKDKWIEDINTAVSDAKDKKDDKIEFSSLKSSSSDNIDEIENTERNSTPEKQIQHRANTTMHVCWHRNTSICMKDHHKAVKNQLSGYLLRKFKNSNGWQKLWVVFTNFCLFFYKTYQCINGSVPQYLQDLLTVQSYNRNLHSSKQDDFPLASLPLLGYAVNTPAEEDDIHKDHVFKLQFKNHVYFFRAESEYTFERWLEVINSATQSARRIRLFSRMESKVDGTEHIC